MKIICAGFPKTGTKSMAKALRLLGYTVNDFEEHLENIDEFLNFFDGEKDSTALMSLHRNIDAVVDQPACTMWHTFFQHYPDSKVILMERDSPEEWYASFVKMIDRHEKLHKVWFENYISWFSPTKRKFDRLVVHNMVRCAAMPLDPSNLYKAKRSRESWISQYVLHSAAVKKLVPEDQLLVFRASQGWQALCKFLDKEVPGASYPIENVAGQKIDEMMENNEFVDRIKKEFSAGLLWTGLLVVLFSVFSAVLVQNLMNRNV